MNIELRQLTPALWPALEKLFGKNGACGGCWCMHWRTEKGEKWADVKGDPARKRFKKLVESGQARGVLAFADGEPVGWCAFGPRPSFSKLNRAPSLACDDAARVWSLPCFYVKAGFRNRGLSSQMLEYALDCLREEGAEVAEGYPVKPHRGQKRLGAFAWTGVVSTFTSAGFEAADRRSKGKQRMRLNLGPA
ncbi:N-acetyltransferase [bacterium]|nr:MAG: N-acetyltransferase [bacterium]RIK62209.1 MAG: GNAT family N-acetyltransferase [Planctomycetota bacterium]